MANLFPAQTSPAWTGKGALDLPAGTVTSVGMVTRFGLLNTSLDTETVTGLAATLFSRTVPVAVDRNATFAGAIDPPEAPLAAVVVAVSPAPPPPPPPPPPLPLPLPLEASVVAGARS